MNQPFPARQRGISFITMLLLAAVVGMTAVVGMEVVPTLLELQAINRAVNKAHDEGGAPAEVRAAFDRAAQVDDIKSINGRDLTIAQDGGNTVSFAYQREIHLFGPAYLTLKYSGQSK